MIVSAIDPIFTAERNKKYCYTTKYLKRGTSCEIFTCQFSCKMGNPVHPVTSRLQASVLTEVISEDIILSTGRKASIDFHLSKFVERKLVPCMN